MPELDMETAQLIGRMLQSVEDIGSRITELVKTAADQGAQIHEIKHSSASQAQATMILGRDFRAHIELFKEHVRSDEKNNAAITALSKENREATRRTIENANAKIAGELQTYRESQETSLKEHRNSIAEDLSEINEDQKTLLAWRSQILGGLAVVGFVVAGLGTIVGFAGHSIAQALAAAWGSLTGHH